AREIPMLTDRRPAARPAPRAYASSRSAARRKRLRRQRIAMLLAEAAGIVALVVVLILTHNAKTQEEQTPEEPAEPQYFYYWNTAFEADPGYPASTIEDAGFVRIGDRLRYLSGTVHSHAGIDVSEHNGEIDWEAVAADGIEFAMIRVGNRGYTAGEIYKDERFDENYEGARAAGLKVGVYFFSQAVSVPEAEAEADFVLKVLKGRKLDLPVAYDWEIIGEENARADDMDRETLTACTAAFCGRVAKKFDAMIYTNAYQCYYLLSLGELSDYPIWFAGYAETPVLYYEYKIWQYSDKGTVSGISKPVDLNLCFFDL
ncbi:MAG: glycoside hydrolase family 25 protein, partial [Oscillospiraceae bacterium]|nr:glycoside hydrolase family 25 protein [Oscillospiraceae bacterium]